MLSIANDLSRYALAAGEPFIMEVIWVDADGERQDLPDDAMVLTFWVPSSAEIVRRIEFDRVADEAGKEVFRIALDGTFSEALRGRSGIQVELARRYRMGRLVVGTGELTIRNSSPDLPSLDSAGIGDVAARLTIRASATFGDPPTLSVRPVQYASAIVPPSYSIRSGDVVALIL